MNVKKMKAAVAKLKEDLGDGLVATDIWSSVDGQSIHGYNAQPKAAALFNQVTQFLDKSLASSKFPQLGKYYVVDLIDEKMVLVIPLDEYQWGILIDTGKVQMGLLINVVLPDIVDQFEDALAG